MKERFQMFVDIEHQFLFNLRIVLVNFWEYNFVLRILEQIFLKHIFNFFEMPVFNLNVRLWKISIKH